MSAPVRLLVVSGAPDPTMVEAMRDAVWLDRHLDQERSVIAGWLRAALSAAPALGVEEIAAGLRGHWLQRSTLGCSCGEVYHGKYDDDALVDWHLGHVASALLAALAARQTLEETR